MICFDMATTVMNNLMDYVKAKNSDYRDNHNVIGTSTITVKKAWQVFGGLFAVAAVVGIILVARTNILLLIVGAICFFIGVFYTFGPSSDFQDASWGSVIWLYDGIWNFLDYGIFKCARRNGFLQGLC